MHKALLAVLAMMLMLSACGDDTLSGLGAASDWVQEVQVEKAPVLPDTGPEGGSGTIAAITWYNGWAEEPLPDRAILIEKIWTETDGADAFVQATPNEIAAVVPGVFVPSDLASDVVQVTSQIVYSTSTGNLDNAYVAAFGFWIDVPYLNSREVSQVGSLRVAIDGNAVIDEADPTLGCARFIDRDFSNCQPAEDIAELAWWVTTIDGVSLIWLQDGFRYELLKRSKLSIEDAENMATSMVPLGRVLPSPSTLNITTNPRR
jgi:hypothetical protein